MIFNGQKFGHHSLRKSLGHRSQILSSSHLDRHFFLCPCQNVHQPLWSIGMEKPCDYSQGDRPQLSGGSPRTHRRHGFPSFVFKSWSSFNDFGQNVHNRGPLLLAQPVSFYTSPKETTLISVFWYPGLIQVTWFSFSFKGTKLSLLLMLSIVIYLVTMTQVWLYKVSNRSFCFLF